MENIHPKIQKEIMDKLKDGDSIFKSPNMINNQLPGEICVILKAGKIYKNKFFSSEKEARNFIKMQNPSRNFKNVGEHRLVCKKYGTTFDINIIYLNNSDEQ